MTSDEAFAELTTLTQISAQDWTDILSLPPEGQIVILQAYRDADWRAQPDTLERVLSILNVIGTIAGTVAGVAGAASAVAALRTL